MRKPIRDIVKIPAEELFLVHINDCENLPREQLTDGHRLYTGLGAIPLVDELKALKGKGYKGFLSIEIFRQDYWKENPEKISMDEKKNLDAVLAKIWLRKL